MRETVKILAAVSFIAAVCAPASAGSMEDLAAGQAAAMNSLSSRNIPNAAVPKPGYSLTRDVFLEVDACSILNAQFIMQPMMKDALNMLKPCLAGFSELTGNAPISADSVKGGKAIEIVVLGGKNKDVQELISGALAKRNNQVFGYPAAAVLHAAEPH